MGLDCEDGERFSDPVDAVLSGDDWLSCAGVLRARATGDRREMTCRPPAPTGKRPIPRDVGVAVTTLGLLRSRLLLPPNVWSSVSSRVPGSNWVFESPSEVLHPLLWREKPLASRESALPAAAAVSSS